MLTARQESVLNFIVEGYIGTATPMPSDVLARRPELNVSPATVRNEVAVLEEQGYIVRPHTSAGSLPTDKAYRLYVVRLQESQPTVDAQVQTEVKRRLLEAQRDLEEWANVAAAALASIVGNMAIATFPRATESRVRHIEVVQLQDVLWLLIVVLEHARLRRQLIRFETPPDLTELERSANKVGSAIKGHSKRELDSLDTKKFSPLEKSLLDTTKHILSEEDAGLYRHHYLDGLRNLLTQPEFTENERVRPVVEAVENGSLAQAILEEVPEGITIRVVIGHENKGNVLQPLSVVVAQYGIPGEVVGAVGAIGPTRMQYSKTIAGVRAMTTVMSEMAEGIRGQ
ncbi:MAG: heat-inducible transcriptional repressor HrcA [Chloroflexi bacterium]|nr:heat-inducible transcriptional repressor HrcA [Chloroflexota bacterium]